jgi:hypothetical protein
MFTKEQSDQVFGGVMLIGLGVLFFTGWWWPGVMFVLGIALLARTYAEGKPFSSNRGALVVLAIGAFFALEDALNIFGNINWLPIVLILIGLYLLFGDRLRGRSEKNKV